MIYYFNVNQSVAKLFQYKQEAVNAWNIAHFQQVRYEQLWAVLI